MPLVGLTLHVCKIPNVIIHNTTNIVVIENRAGFSLGFNPDRKSSINPDSTNFHWWIRYNLQLEVTGLELLHNHGLCGPCTNIGRTSIEMHISLYDSKREDVAW